GALPGRPRGHVPAAAAGDQTAGGRGVGGRARRLRGRRGRGPPAVGAQPPQSAGPPDHRRARAGPGGDGGRGTVRPGPAARAPPAATGGLGAAQPLVPRPARQRDPPGESIVTHDAASLWHLLRQVERMPFGAGQIAAVEEVDAPADAAGLRDLAFAAPMLATDAYVQGGEPAKAFVTFSWCLADFDADPGRHDRAHALELLWHFKFAVRALTMFPDIPLDRTYAVLDDMERRYR